MFGASEDDGLSGGLLDALQAQGSAAALSAPSMEDLSAEYDSARGASKELFGVLRSRGLNAAISAPLADLTDAKLAEEYDDEGVDLGAEALNAKSTEEKYEALKRKHQRNLDDPAQLAISGLEDPALVVHTAARRARLAELEKEREELPDEALLLDEDTKARRALSTFVGLLEELQQQIDCESCTLLGLSKKMDATLAKQVAASSAQLEKTAATIRQAQATLTTARRSCETALEGMKVRAGHFRAAFENSRA